MSEPTADVVTFREPPLFLQRREAAAQFAYWSNGRLLIVKDGEQISLSPDDLAEFWRFVARCEGVKP